MRIRPSDKNIDNISIKSHLKTLFCLICVDLFWLIKHVVSASLSALFKLFMEPTPYHFPLPQFL